MVQRQSASAKGGMEPTKGLTCIDAMPAEPHFPKGGTTLKATGRRGAGGRKWRTFIFRGAECTAGEAEDNNNNQTNYEPKDPELQFPPSCAGMQQQ